MLKVIVFLFLSIYTFNTTNGRGARYFPLEEGAFLRVDQGTFPNQKLEDLKLEFKDLRLLEEQILKEHQDFKAVFWAGEFHFASKNQEAIPIKGNAFLFIPHKNSMWNPGLKIRVFNGKKYYLVIVNSSKVSLRIPYKDYLGAELATCLKKSTKEIVRYKVKKIHSDSLYLCNEQVVIRLKAEKKYFTSNKHPEELAQAMFLLRKNGQWFYTYYRTKKKTRNKIRLKDFKPCSIDGKKMRLYSSPNPNRKNWDLDL